MPDFTQFFSAILSAVADFLMTEPISYFVGLTVLLFVAGLVRYIMFGERRGR